MNQVIHSVNPENLTMSSGRVKELRGRGYVYACAYSGGSVKIGMSERRPEQRIKCHNHTMRIAGERLVESYISQEVAAPKAVEARVIAEISKRFARVSSEWFKGVAISEIKDVIEAVSVPANTPAAIEENKKSELDVENAAKLFHERIEKAEWRSGHRSEVNGYLFSQCLDFASCMEQVMLAGPLQDHEDLDRLDRQGYSPCSQFLLMASIALFTRPRSGWDELFSAAVASPHWLMRHVKEVMRAHAKNIQELV